MKSKRRDRAATYPEAFYQPSWAAALLALAGAFLLAWHG